MSANRWTGADVTSTARPRRPITSQQTCLPVCSSCVSMFTQRKLCVKTWACWCGHVFVSGAGSVHQQSAASPGPGGLAALYRWLTSTSPVTSPVTWLYVKDEKTPVKSSSSYRTSQVVSASSAVQTNAATEKTSELSVWICSFNYLQTVII